MDYMRSTISKHNFKILSQTKPPIQIKSSCNCRNKEECPLQQKCPTISIVYQADVTSNDNGETKSYIGMTGNSFKELYRNHAKSFNEVLKRNRVVKACLGPKETGTVISHQLVNIKTGCSLHKR